MAAARPLVDDPVPEPQPRPNEGDDAAWAELARLFLEGARRLRRKREAAQTREQRREQP